MTAPIRRRRQLATILALLTLLGATSGWSQPAAFGHQPQAVSGQDVAAGRASVVAERALVADGFLAANGSAALALFAQRPAAVIAAGLVASVHVRDQAPVDAAAAAPSAGKPSVKPPAAASYSGRNHFWIPSLGMSYAVHPYACGRTSYPANLVYRWGCGGTNNVYLLGHAASVMKPLHDLYVRGGLHVGLLAMFADSSGRIRAYRVTAWQVVYPTEVAWAIASQPVPSMTLQTCVGPNSSKRLNVRLVAVD